MRYFQCTTYSHRKHTVLVALTDQDWFYHSLILKEYYKFYKTTYLSIIVAELFSISKKNLFSSLFFLLPHPVVETNKLDQQDDMDHFYFLRIYIMGTLKVNYIYLPSINFRIAAELVLSVGCKRGPTTIPGFIVIRLMPCSFENFQAASSAKVFESTYHSLKKN